MALVFTVSLLFSLLASAVAFTDPLLPTSHPKSQQSCGRFRYDSHFPAPALSHQRCPLFTFLSGDEFDDGEYDYDDLFRSPAELSRPRRRTVYDHESWLKQRSTDRFFRNLASFPKSYIIRSLLDEVAVIVGFCLFIIIWNESLFDGWTDLAGIRHEPVEVAGMISGMLPRILLPALPFSLSSPPLGLLLVFRTNTSYARWNDGRKSWTQIATRSRSLLLMAATWVESLSPDDTDMADKIEALQRLGEATWALPRTLRHRVLGEWDPDDDYEAEIRSRLDSTTAERILSARNPILSAQSNLIQAMENLPGLTDRKRATLCLHISTINDLCGKCEGLYTSPVPLSYTRHTARFLTIWMLLLPAALYEPFGTSWNHLAMIPATAVLSFLFFGVEEIAVSLEEPFSILPLDRTTEGIWMAVEDMVEWFVDESGYSNQCGSKS